RFSRDWSSDVCSSDLVAQVHRAVVDTRQQIVDVILAGLRHGLLEAWAQDAVEFIGVVRGQGQRTHPEVFRQQAVYKQAQQGGEQIGRASCRERVNIYE